MNKTEDFYVCVSCLHTGSAIEAADKSLTCESCGGDDLITHQEWARRDREEEDAWHAAADAAAEANPHPNAALYAAMDLVAETTPSRVDTVTVPLIRLMERQAS